jgi:hypothetical protein
VSVTVAECSLLDRLGEW